MTNHEHRCEQCGEDIRRVGESHGCQPAPDDVEALIEALDDASFRQGVASQAKNWVTHDENAITKQELKADVLAAFARLKEEKAALERENERLKGRNACEECRADAEASKDRARGLESDNTHSAACARLVPRIPARALPVGAGEREVADRGRRVHPALLRWDVDHDMLVAAAR